METVLLPLAGLLGVIVALAHGWLGETKIIAHSKFPGRQAKGFVRAMWHLSSASWIAGSLLIAASPWLVTPAQRPWVVAYACLPMVWSIVANAWISRGRHFGWMALAVVVGLAALGVALGSTPV